MSEEPLIRKILAAELEDSILQYKQLELDSLLEVTSAINQNSPAESLYKNYGFILQAQMNVQRIVVFYNNDGNWECTHQVGIDEQMRNNLQFDAAWVDYQEPVKTKDTKLQIQSQFEILLPVFHKDRALAYVLLGDIGSNFNESFSNRLNFIRTITNIIIVAIENKRLFKKQIEQEALKREMAFAEKMQNMLIPRHLPNNEFLNISAIYQPHFNVGGDYYDVIQVSDFEILTCIADVSGKGIAAAILMANFQALLRVFAKGTVDLCKLVQQLNESVESITRGERFITLFLALYNTQTRQLRYINLGHPPQLLFDHNNKSVAYLSKGGTIIGAFESLPKIEETCVEVAPNSTLLMYTDGLSDLVSEAGQYFDEKMLLSYLEQAGTNVDSKVLNEKLFQHLENFRGEKAYTDDISILTLKIN